MDDLEGWRDESVQWSFCNRGCRVDRILRGLPQVLRDVVGFFVGTLRDIDSHSNVAWKVEHFKSEIVEGSAH